MMTSGSNLPFEQLENIFAMAIKIERKLEVYCDS